MLSLMLYLRLSIFHLSSPADLYFNILLDLVFVLVLLVFFSILFLLFFIEYTNYFRSICLALHSDANDCYYSRALLLSLLQTVVIQIQDKDQTVVRIISILNEGSTDKVLQSLKSTFLHSTSGNVKLNHCEILLYILPLLVSLPLVCFFSSSLNLLLLLIFNLFF